MKLLSFENYQNIILHGSLLKIDYHLMKLTS